MASRLFDSGAAAKIESANRASKESVRKRAEDIERMLQEEVELDKATADLGKRLSASMGVTPIRYKEFRLPGSKWMIEHTLDATDYIYQMFPLRPMKSDWRDTIVLLIAAMDSVFPRSLEIRYIPPSEKYQIKYFTIKLINVASLPGWEDACTNRALRSLSAVQAS